MKDLTSNYFILGFLALQSCSGFFHQASNINAQTKMVVVTNQQQKPLSGVRCGFDAPFSPKTNKRGKLVVSEKDAVGTGEMIFVHPEYNVVSYPSYESVPSVIVMYSK
jgi:hypothetical protein